MADVCKWCKGTKVILGFAWNTYPCECAQAPVRTLPEGVRLNGDQLSYTPPGRFGAAWLALDVPSIAVAQRFCEWAQRRHPRMFSFRDSMESNAYFDSLSPGDRAEISDRVQGKCA